MKLNTTDFGRRCQFPILMAAGSLPLPMLICANALTGSVSACLVLAGLYVVLAWLCTLTPGKLRIPAGVLCAAGIFLASAALLPYEKLLPALLIPIMYVLLLLGGLRIGGWEPGRELHPLVSAICLIAHMVAQFLVNLDRQNRAEPIYSSVSVPLAIAFLIFGALAMLALNRASLNSAVNGRSAVPKAMRWKNRVLTVGMMAVVLLVASLPAVIKALSQAWEWIKYGLLRLIWFLMSLFPQSDSAGGGQGGGMDLSGLVEETAEESLLSKIITAVLLVLAIIIMAVLVVIALRIVWKKLKVLFKALWARLNEYMVSSSEDYVDEIADTRDDAEHERLLRRRRKKQLRKRVDESTLTPQQRIRYRYLQMWLRHPEWTPERTARENLTGDAAQLYERARYSTHEVTQRDADAFAQTLESRKG